MAFDPDNAAALKEYVARRNGEADRLVGEILDHLGELAVSDETVVVVAADHGQLLGAAGELVCQLSMVLDKPPRGHARNYLVSKRELRGLARFGPAAARYVSLSGIVALYREPGDRLRGSFRLQVARQSSLVTPAMSRTR